MNNLIQSILTLLQNMLGGGPARAAETDSGSGGGAESEPVVSHALVLPDADFRDWYEATRAYTSHFENVIVVRSPAGNNLNRYKVVTAIKNGRTWYNSDPVAHIRRAYPNVVTVDVLTADAPTALQPQLAERVRTNQRLGANTQTRFTLDWPTDSLTLRIVREFDVPIDSSKFHEGIDIGATNGTVVRAACAGTVFNVTTDGGTLGYGAYVQVEATAQDGTSYLITYTQLTDIRVKRGQKLTEGDILGKCASSWGIKLVVQQTGVDTGDRYTMPGAIDPVPLLYVDGIRLETTASGLNIRKGRGTEYEKVGMMLNEHTATPLEMHGITVRKTLTTADDNQWINLDTSTGVTGFGAAWFLQAKSPRSAKVIDANINGVNLDVRHRLGAPNPARLNALTYVRMGYNVSNATGNQDLNAAYEVYAPYIDSLVNAGKKVILVYTHQTYGEGVYDWDTMTTPRWQELSARFAEFLQVIAKQYRGKIAAHQIWNEQDAYKGAVASVRIEPIDYAYLLTMAIQSIRSVDPSTPIITGGHTSGPQGGANYAKTTFAAMPAGVRPDGVAAHPYGRGAGDVPKYQPFGSIDETIKWYSQVMPGKPVWITEWGVLDSNNEPTEDITRYAKGFLDRLQTKHAGKVAATVWYAWAESMHNGYGLVNKAEQAREPLYTTYTSIR